MALCQEFVDPVVYKAVLLTAFFGFFHLSNLAPHLIAEFDSARHFTGGGSVFFQENEVKLLIKWSKTMQYRDEYKFVALPKLGASPICPYRALRNAIAFKYPGVKFSPVSNQGGIQLANINRYLHQEKPVKN